MKLRTLLTIGLMCAATVYADAPRGTVPRATAESYPAHTIANGVSIGAVLLTGDQARKAFASDVDRCCVVVEVALYPEKNSAVKVSLNDFVLRVTGTDVATKPSTAEVLAAKLQKQSSQSSSSGGHDVVLYPTAGVGYESGGYDPVTGQRRPGGVVTSGGVGVGIGGSQPQGPASTDRDRRTMELELSEKALPEGNASTPVSGYLYFALPSRKDKKTTRQLEYTLNGEKVVLQLP
ncbi:MAG TPA: hypothetical protein VKY85_12440 [Candidatus Angelobacter sp.]|nr:hypothetical protein [Candidatus Angelobacter sp.]